MARDNVDEETALIANCSESSTASSDKKSAPTSVDEAAEHLTSLSPPSLVTGEREGPLAVVSDLRGAGPWGRYNEVLESHPIMVKGITAFFILGLGDLCGQAVEHLRGEISPESGTTGIDWPRAVRFGLFGLIGAPWCHYYFFYLDYYLPPTPEPFTRTTAMKLLIDQGIQAPLLLALIVCALSLLKGEGIDGVKEEMSKSYMNALFANWKLWIPASLFNLAFVKPTLRVLYVNVVFFIWTIILSIILNSGSS